MRISDWSSDVCSSDLQQQIIFDVEDARGVVGALQKRAELREMKAIAAQHRAGQRAAHLAVLAPNRRQHVGQVVLAHRTLEQRDKRHPAGVHRLPHPRSEEHTSELQSLMRNSYAVFGVKKKK